MKKMKLPVPNTGVQFLRDRDVGVQISRWPKTLTLAYEEVEAIGLGHNYYLNQRIRSDGPTLGSPLLAFALDGFSIHGPYNTSGHLVTVESGQLDQCNFHKSDGVYYFTPDFPFGPTWFVRPQLILTLTITNPNTNIPLTLTLTLK
jgi:hypothetical protein